MSKSVIKIDLERELPDGNTQIEKVTIKKMKFRQFNRVLGIVTQIAEIIEETPDLQKLLGELFQGEDFNAADYPDATEEELLKHVEAFKKEKDRKFAESIVGSFRVLLARLPDHAMELLAAVAKIDVELMLDQEIEVGFDVLDAVLEVNDIKEIIERGKQSFRVGKGAVAFLFENKKEDAEAAKAH